MLAGRDTGSTLRGIWAMHVTGGIASEDIGRLVQSASLPHPGVLYLRLRGAGGQLLDAFRRIWPRIESGIDGHFVTVKNEQVRRRPLPVEPST